MKADMILMDSLKEFCEKKDIRSLLKQKSRVKEIASVLRVLFYNVVLFIFVGLRFIGQSKS